MRIEEHGDLEGSWQCSRPSVKMEDLSGSLSMTSLDLQINLLIGSEERNILKGLL